MQENNKLTFFQKFNTLERKAMGTLFAIYGVTAGILSPLIGQSSAKLFSHSNQPWSSIFIHTFVSGGIGFVVFGIIGRILPIRSIINAILKIFTIPTYKKTTLAIIAILCFIMTPLSTFISMKNNPAIVPEIFWSKYLPQVFTTSTLAFIVTLFSLKGIRKYIEKRYQTFNLI